eukprot:9273536-Pyramimonas_sp.AAC.1
MPVVSHVKSQCQLSSPVTSGVSLRSQRPYLLFAHGCLGEANPLAPPHPLVPLWSRARSTPHPPAHPGADGYGTHR